MSQPDGVGTVTLEEAEQAVRAIGTVLRLRADLRARFGDDEEPLDCHHIQAVLAHRITHGRKSWPPMTAPYHLVTILSTLERPYDCRYVQALAAAHLEAAPPLSSSRMGGGWNKIHGAARTTLRRWSRGKP